ncbi:unnamed protein product [Urochloa humidicola]
MAAAADSDPIAVITSTCAHCQREIPSSNIALHSVHCARNLQKCEHCRDMIPTKLMDEHYDENHAPMNCSLCKCTIERELWDLHTSIQCPQRMLACQYCEFELPAVDLLEHQEVHQTSGMDWASTPVPYKLKCFCRTFKWWSSSSSRAKASSWFTL